ncbi:MAG: hypothetical protein JOZ78_07760 [Chroococcidiopsidaceae cyanobacterium CP_BM_ER_R8_30]|nr:hypothetical protein [Chroococcidiopsidaceae cyanobacterium CP_BM_ER_R8_30]
MNRIKFLNERFSLDQELRLSGEQRLKLEIIRSLKESCDHLTYGKRLKEAAKRIGKSERTVSQGLAGRGISSTEPKFKDR